MYATVIDVELYLLCTLLNELNIEGMARDHLSKEGGPHLMSPSRGGMRLERNTERGATPLQ